MNSPSTALYTRVPVKNRVRMSRLCAGLGRNGHDRTWVGAPFGRLRARGLRSAGCSRRRGRVSVRCGPRYPSAHHNRRGDHRQADPRRAQPVRPPRAPGVHHQIPPPGVHRRHAHLLRAHHARRLRRTRRRAGRVQRRDRPPTPARAPTRPPWRSRHWCNGSPAAPPTPYGANTPAAVSAPACAVPLVPRRRLPPRRTAVDHQAIHRRPTTATLNAGLPRRQTRSAITHCVSR